MECLIEGLALPTHHIRIHKMRVFSIVMFFSIVYPVPVYCQFADLPHDAKTVDMAGEQTYKKSGKD